MNTTALSEVVPVRSRWWNSRVVLLIAFAFSVMADPVSSVSYAIEAALRALGGRLDLLVAAMAAVVFVVALVVGSYHQLVARFPEGGGSAAATGKAFGEGWSFVPMGALVVDFVLTIAISVSAGVLRDHLVRSGRGAVSAVARAWPAHARGAPHAVRAPGARGVRRAHAGVPRHRGDGAVPGPEGPRRRGDHRARADEVGASGRHPGLSGGDGACHRRRGSFLGDRAAPSARRRGQARLRTVGAVAHPRHRRRADDRAWPSRRFTSRSGCPGEDTTLVAEIARAGSSGSVFAAFQGATALLLLSAASSSFQAGPGLLKALARSATPGEARHGVLPVVLRPHEQAPRSPRRRRRVLRALRRGRHRRWSPRPGTRVVLRGRRLRELPHGAHRDGVLRIPRAAQGLARAQCRGRASRWPSPSWPTCSGPPPSGPLAPRRSSRAGSTSRGCARAAPAARRMRSPRPRRRTT